MRQLVHYKISSPKSLSARHIPALDGLRGLAILMVLAVHLGGGRQSPHLVVRSIANGLRLGWIGVSLFFVLSGFLISGILWDSFSTSDWWSRFYLRRSLRIFPLYYLSLVYAAIVLALYARPTLSVLPTYVFYLQDFPWFDSHIAAPQISLLHFWSLAVEEQFYLIWPLVLFLLRHRRAAAIQVCLLGILSSFIFRLLMVHMDAGGGWSYGSLPARTGELMLGAMLALSVRGPTSELSRLFKLAPYALAASVSALVALSVAAHGSFESTEPLWLTWGLLILPIFFAGIIILCLRPSPIQRLMEHPLLRAYGRISYGVYVFHLLLGFPFTKLVNHFAANLNPELYYLVRSLTIIVGSTLLAVLSFYTFEAYFRKLKGRLSTSLPQQTSEAIIPSEVI